MLKIDLSAILLIEGVVFSGWFFMDLGVCVQSLVLLLSYKQWQYFKKILTVWAHPDHIAKSMHCYNFSKESKKSW